VALLLVGVAVGSVAQPAEEPVDLRWSAPSVCPPRATVLAEVRRLIGERSGEPLEASGAILREGGVFRLTLRVGGGERVLRDADCASLARAAGLILALAIDPDAAMANASANTTASSASDAAVDVTQASVEVDGGLEAPRDVGSEDAGVQRPDASVPTGDAGPEPRDAGDAGSDAGLDAGPDAGPESAGGLTPPRARPGPPLDGVSLALGGGVELGTLPSPSPALHLALRLPILERGTVGAAFHVALPRGTEVEDHPSARAELFQIALQLDAGVRLEWRRLRARVAGLAELGLTQGRGSGVTSARTGRTAWLALGVTGFTGVRLGRRLDLGVEADLRVPLLRPGFEVAGAGLAFRVPSVVGRAGLQARVHLR